MTIDDLIIDPKFRDLIPKLTDAEYAQLEKNILEDGRVKEPIIVWDKTIVDGHHRYYILQKHPEIPYAIEEKEFQNEHAAMAWACDNQLGRRNLKDHDRDYLIGKRYSEEKLVYGTNRYTAKDKDYLIGEQSQAEKGIAEGKRNQNDFSKKREEKTYGRLAKEYGIGSASVQRDEQFAKGIDIAEEVIPGMKDKILHGEVDAPKSVIQKIPKATPDKQRKAAIALSENNVTAAKTILEGEKKKDLEPEPEPYNIDDLLEEVKAAGEELHSALNQTLVVVHKDILIDKKNRNKAIEGLREIMDDVQEYIETVLEMED